MPSDKAVLHRYLRTGREAILWKLEGLSEYDLRRPLVPTGTNLLGLVKHPDRASVTLQQILVHMIAETHRHAGHAGIVRELIDGEVGLRRDNDNLPPADRQWWAAYRDRLEQRVHLRAARGYPLCHVQEHPPTPQFRAGRNGR